MFGRQQHSEETFARTNDEMYQASWGAQFISGIIMPANSLKPKTTTENFSPSTRTTSSHITCGAYCFVFRGVPRLLAMRFGLP